MDVKHAFSVDSSLVHYCQGKPLILQTDASGQGLGAVLLQPDVNGVLRLVTYKSRVLQPAEKNYSQIEREALAIAFSIENFRQYFLGQKFESALTINHCFLFWTN